MAILSGTRLGPYEVLSSVGAGGMGEVYRARDTRLDRTVAIKILPDHLADRPNLRERFEREAKTIASLNHPHICTLHDVGHQDGTDYLVMEHIEGETLAQRLAKGPLPLELTLQYAVEIADALDKAHRKGITHRDLKPSNIMLTKTGTKLLDFGLAKLTQGDRPAAPYSELPTEKDGITAEGTILGTLQYMAPEQVEGKEADARTDIFAFGVVVYEMATGKKAFEGKSQASLIAKILETEPAPISTLQPMTPPALDRLVKKCLAKEPERRWQAASDLCDELKWISEQGAPQTVNSAATVRPGRKYRREVAWVGAASVACIAVAIAAWMLKPAAPAPVTRFALSLPVGQSLVTSRAAIAISPDGTRLVYAAATNGGATQLYVRLMDGLEAQVIPETAGAVNPFFSPDGQSVGFFAGGKLEKVSLKGGSPVTLADTGSGPGWGASWSSQGTIAFGSSTFGPIRQVPDAGGNLQPLTSLADELAHVWPQFLPGGKGLVFIADQPTTRTTLVAESLVTRKRQDLVQLGLGTIRYAPLGSSTIGPSAFRFAALSGATYAGTGHLVYTQTSTLAQISNLMAVPFDAQRLTVTGPALPVIENVLPWQFSFSSTGSLIYIPAPGQATAQFKLVWADRNGAEQPLPAPPHNYVIPRLSPDGQRVVAGIEEGDGQIWVYDLRRDTLTRLTFEGRENVDPIWTPDGRGIVFKGAGNRMFSQPADGSGPAKELINGVLSPNNVPGSFSPDGEVLAFMAVNPNTGRDLYTLSLKTGKPQAFVATPSIEAAPQFSPDGRFIAYASDESGRVEIYVRPYPGPGGKWQISTEGGGEPAWNPRGRELFYRSGDKMMAVDVSTQGTFTAGKPRMLFEKAYVPSPLSSRDYDVSPDGQRFLMLKSVEQAQAQKTAQINVVLNWFEELKQKVPTGKK